MLVDEWEEMYKRCNQIITSIAISNEGGVSGVDSVDIDVVLIIVAEGGDNCRLTWTCGWTIGGIGIARVRGEGASSVLGLVGKLTDLLTNEIVSRLADAGIEEAVVDRVLRAASAPAIDTDVARLTEAAALIPVLIEAAGGLDNGIAGLSVAVVDLAV